MSAWSHALRQILVDNSIEDWLSAALIFLLIFAVLPLLRGYLRARRRRYDPRNMPPPVALLALLAERTSVVILWIFALFCAERILTLPPKLDRAFEIAIIVGWWLQVGIWAGAAARFALTLSHDRAGDATLAGSVDIVLFVARLIIWIVVALLTLENVGINVGPLIAGLGVGGIAIALAVQTILGDLFASLSIALDRPFVVGDLLRIDAFEGTVEQIGIKSTRLRSVSGEQIIISNADLLKSRVRNLGRASEWRALFMLSVAIDTAPALVTRIPGLVETAVSSYEGARFSYCLLKQIGEAALGFEVCFFVANSPGRDLGQALDQVNREILEAFAADGIAWATPARVVYLREGRAPASVELSPAAPR